MKALVIEAPHRIAIRELPVPKPGRYEVTVKVKQAGICGTDYHLYEGHLDVAYPLVPGHEFSGIVHEVGEGVTDYAPGDRVGADPSVTCGRCRFCRTNRFNLCVHFGGLGTTLQGSMAEYVVVSAHKLVKLPDQLSFEEAAFIEPVACVVHAMNRLQMEIGSRVLLFGAGAMGLQLVQALAQNGASELTVVDMAGPKLELALQLGATRGLSIDQAEAELRHSQGADGYDIVVDATGIPAVIQQALQYMGPSAKFLQFGVAPPQASVEISPFRLYQSDWTFIGSMALNSTFLPAFQWVKEGRIRLMPLISHQISVEEAVEWFQGAKPPHALKTQIRFS